MKSLSHITYEIPVTREYKRTKEDERHRGGATFQQTASSLADPFMVSQKGAGGPPTTQERIPLRPQSM